MQVWLGELDPDAVQVELCAAGIEGGPAHRQAMARGCPSGSAPGSYVFTAQAPSSRPSQDYTARLVPRFDGEAIPLESGLILWQR